MKRISFLFIITALMFCASGCTDNSLTKHFGGNTSIKLEKGEKLMNVVFQENDIWYLTRKMKSTDIPECYKFQEKSRFGVLEGTVNICEQK